MPLLLSRPYAGPPDLLPLIELARHNTAAREPGWSYYHLGDVTWQLAPLESNDDVQLWELDGAVVAFATFEPPGVLAFDVRDDATGDETLVDAVLAWAIARLRALPAGSGAPAAYAMLAGGSLSTEVMDTDQRRTALLASRGFRQVERGGVRFRADLSLPIALPELPPGMHVRHATASDIDERVDLHRDAWSVWGPSSFTAVKYRRLRAAPNYDETLDIVLDDGNGRLLSYCLCWADTSTGIATFEPVGTRPSAAGQGLGRATIRAALAHLRGRGLRWATVSTASVNTPAIRLYQSAGFDLIGRSHYYAKPIV